MIVLGNKKGRILAALSERDSMDDNISKAIKAHVRRKAICGMGGGLEGMYLAAGPNKFGGQ